MKRATLIAWFLVAVMVGASTVSAQPVSATTCCRAMALTPEWVIVLNNARIVQVRARSGGDWLPMESVGEKAVDLASGDRLWLLTSDGFVAGLDDKFRVAIQFEVGRDALSLGVAGRIIRVARPGPQVLVIDSYSESGEQLGSSSLSVPLSDLESRASRRMPVAHRMGFDLMHLAAGPGGCAAVYRFRNLLVPCDGGTNAVRWGSSASLQEEHLAAFEDRSRLSSRPRPHTFQAVAWRDGYAAIEWLTRFDPESGRYEQRDQVALLTADGSVTHRVALGRQALAIAAFEGDLFVLLDESEPRLKLLEVPTR